MHNLLMRCVCCFVLETLSVVSWSENNGSRKSRDGVSAGSGSVSYWLACAGFKRHRVTCLSRFPKQTTKYSCP